MALPSSCVHVVTTFSVATLNGKFVIGTIPASSLASVNRSGYVTANGAGNTTYVLDENVGVPRLA